MNLLSSEKRHKCIVFECIRLISLKMMNVYDDGPYAELLYNLKL